MGKSIDLTGRRFGSLVVIRFDHNKKFKTVTHKYWLCRCDCGNEAIVTGNNLKSGNTKSCGCLKDEVLKKSGFNNAKDITGKKFGCLIALHPTRDRMNGSVMWRCKCDCGNEVDIRLFSLTSGGTKSCGCKQIEAVKNNLEKGSKIYNERDKVEGTSLDQIKIDKPLIRSNTSGHRGVYKHRCGWVAAIQFRGKKHYLGYFSDINDAIAARKAAEEKYFKPVLEEHENKKKEGKK